MTDRQIVWMEQTVSVIWNGRTGVWVWRNGVYGDYQIMDTEKKELQCKTASITCSQLDVLDYMG